MRLIKATLEAPAGLLEFLREIGDGENGFMGEPDVVAGAFGAAPDAAAGRLTLEKYLQGLADMEEGRNLRPGWVPMTTYWLVDEAGAVLGVSRLRHRLTPFLREHGGHIGYYVAKAQRGEGYGRRILALTLEAARGLGLERVLLTVDSDNEPSIRVIEGNGGVMEDEGIDSTTGKLHRRYWLELG